MRVVFLDIDGVLNQGYDEMRGAPSGFDYCVESCVVALNALTRATGAKLVVSSSWREAHPFPELRALLASKFGVEGEVVDMTPLDLETPEGWPVARISEIRHFLDLRPYVESFVVLDDLDITVDINNAHVRDDEIEGRLVRTSTKIGLTAADATRAAKVLARPRQSA